MPLARRLLIACLLILSTSGLGRAATIPFLGASRGETVPAPEGRAPGAVITGVGLSSNWAPAAPTLDGVIGGPEWSGAQVYNISFSATPVTLYVMNDAYYLYVAIDAQPDVSLDPSDSAVLFFDDEGGAPPLLGDGLWTAPACPATEGLIASGNNFAAGDPADNEFLGISSGGAVCLPFAPATGVTGAYSFASGHMVYEVRYDRGASQLHVLPGQTFGAFIGCFDNGSGYVGGTSSAATLIDPSTYLPLTLALPPPAATNVIYGTLGNADDLLVTVDPATGTATAVGSPGVGALPGLAVNTAGEIYATSIGINSKLYRLDPLSGQAFLVGPTGVNYVEGIAFDRDGQLWGMSFSGSSTLFKIDTSTGAATPVGGPTGETVVALAFDPNDGTLFGATGAGGGGTIDAIFTVNTASGTLTLVGTTGLGGATPDLAFDVAGRLYGVKGGGGSGGGAPVNRLIAIDKTTGAGTVVGLTGIDGISGLGSQAFLGQAATNVLYGSTSGGAGGDLLTLDPTTGAGGLVGNTGIPGVPALAIDGFGNMYGTSRAPGVAADLYRIDAATGASYLVGNIGFSFADAMAFDRDNVLWAITCNGAAGCAGLQLIRMDPATAATTVVAPVTLNFTGMAFDPTDGRLYASTGAGGDVVYTLDTGTGTATLVGPTGTPDGLTDLAFDVIGRLFATKTASGGSGGTPGASTLIRVNKATGAGLVLGPIGFNGVSGAASRAFLPRVVEHVIYGTQGKAGDLLVKIDPASGVGTPIGNTGVSPMPGLAISPAGDMYAVRGGVSPNDLYRIDPVTAQAFLVGNTGIPYFDSITFDNDGTLYGIGVAGSKTLFKINLVTAAAAAIGATGEQLAGLAVDPATGEMYASTGSFPTHPSSIYRVNKATGTIALIGDLGILTPNNAIPDITIDATGQMFGVIGSGGGGGGAVSSDWVQIDKSTGAGVVIGPVGTVGVSGLDTWAYGAALDVASQVSARGTRLEAARPNPFGHSTELRFALGRSGPVKIEVFNVLGQRVTTLTNATFEAGEHFVRWNGIDAAGRPVADGIYYVRLRAGDMTLSKAVVRIN